LTVPAPDLPCSEDTLLGGRVKLRQPRHGYRAAIDPVLLAAAVPAGDGDTLLDIGCGAGTTVLALAARVGPSGHVLGVDISQQSIARARERIAAAGHELGPDEVLVERGGREGWAVGSGDGVTVALDLTLDDELLLEGEAYELIHRVNTLRKEQGFELSDRIVLTVPDEMRGLVEKHGEWIKGEVLAVDVQYGDELALEKR